MFAADPIRTALRDGWTDGRMPECGLRPAWFLQFIDKADCALGIVQGPHPSIPFSSLPTAIDHFYCTTIDDPSSVELQNGENKRFSQ